MKQPKRRPLDKETLKRGDVTLLTQTLSSPAPPPRSHSNGFLPNQRLPPASRIPQSSSWQSLGSSWQSLGSPCEIVGLAELGSLHPCLSRGAPWLLSPGTHLPTGLPTAAAELGEATETPRLLTGRTGWGCYRNVCRRKGWRAAKTKPCSGGTVPPPRAPSRPRLASTGRNRGRMLRPRRLPGLPSTPCSGLTLSRRFTSRAKCNLKPKHVCS